MASLTSYQGAENPYGSDSEQSSSGESSDVEFDYDIIEDNKNVLNEVLFKVFFVAHGGGHTNSAAALKRNKNDPIARDFINLGQTKLAELAKKLPKIRKIRKYRDTIPGHVLVTQDEIDEQRAFFYNRNNWQKIHHDRKKDLRGKMGVGHEYYRKWVQSGRVNTKDEDKERGSGELVQNGQVFELDLEDPEIDDVIFQEDISLELGSGGRLQADFGIYIPDIQEDGFGGIPKNQQMSQNIFRKKAGPKTSETDVGEFQDLKISQVMENTLDELSKNIDKYPLLKEATVIEFYFTSCSPFNDPSHLKKGTKRIVKSESSGRRQYKVAHLDSDEWFIFLIQLIKRIRVFKKGKKKMELFAEEFENAPDYDRTRSSTHDEIWDAFVSNAEEDERKETWVTIDQLLNRKLAPTRPPQEKLYNNPDIKTQWENRWFKTMTNQKLAEKFNQYKLLEDGLIVEILKGETIGFNIPNPPEGKDIYKLYYYIIWHYLNPIQFKEGGLNFPYEEGQVPISGETGIKWFGDNIVKYIKGLEYKNNSEYREIYSYLMQALPEDYKNYIIKKQKGVEYFQEVIKKILFKEKNKKFQTSAIINEIALTHTLNPENKKDIKIALSKLKGRSISFESRTDQWQWKEKRRNVKGVGSSKKKDNNFSEFDGGRKTRRRKKTRRKRKKRTRKRTRKKKKRRRRKRRRTKRKKK
tara:strand:- start:3083 stop:5164 length:2082 start_codon:yes stop_codon:yes gene_type:complete